MTYQLTSQRIAQIQQVSSCSRCVLVGKGRQIRFSVRLTFYWKHFLSWQLVHVHYNERAPYAITTPPPLSTTIKKIQVLIFKCNMYIRRYVSTVSLDTMLTVLRHLERCISLFGKALLCILEKRVINPFEKALYISFKKVY